MTTPYQEGPSDAKLVFVLEAPGRTEIVQGRPVVGPSGKLFNSYLQSADIIRSDCHIANVCREQIKSVDEYVGTKGLTQKGIEVADDLRKRLELLNPNTIVAMGKLACCALTGDPRIMKMRGSPLECKLLPGIEVIPTIHPAATLPYRGNSLWRFYIDSDLRKAKRHSEKPGVIKPARELIIGSSYYNTLEFLSYIGQAPRYAYDIEVYNHQVSCISFAREANISMSIPFTGDYWTEEQECMIWKKIGELQASDKPKIAQYGSFDMSFLLIQNHIRTNGRLLDPYIAQRIMYPGFPASLEFLLSIYTDEPYYKDDRKLWRTMGKDIERFWRYNANDSACTFELWEALEPDLEADEGFMRTYDMTLEALEPCMYLMTNGIKIDVAALKETRIEVGKQLDAKLLELKKTASSEFNPESAKQVLAYFYVEKGLHPYLSRKTGKPTCDDKALSRIVRRYNLPEARILQEIRSLTKLKGTYLDLGYDEDERLRCFYNVRGTKLGGRLSSSKTVRETGMNFQNLHPAFKRFLVPDDG